MAGRASPVDHFRLTGSTLAGRYYVESQVAEGGFAVVYRAYQAPLDRFVAVKVLKTPPLMEADTQASFRARFAAEARTIAKLKHPYIVSVYDFGVDVMPSGEAAPWMALEWLDGETLEADLERRRGAGGRSPMEVLRLLRPIVEALAYAHRQGIVHRDVKPANLMMVPAENGRVLRMMDFGISKLMGHQPDSAKHTGTSEAPGFSPDYASPEQVTFSRTGPWTDVHALGLVMTEMLTDEPPYAEGGDVHVFEQVMAAERPTPRRKGKRVGRLERVIGRAVALSPRKRWQDAGELLAAIDGVSLSGATQVWTKGDDSPSERTAPLWRLPRPSPRSSVTLDRVTGALGLGTIVAALAIVGSTLGSEHHGLSVSEEFANAAARTPRTSSLRPSGGDSATPWVIPLPTSAPPPSAAPAGPSTAPALAVAPVLDRRWKGASEPGRAGSTGSGNHVAGERSRSQGYAEEAAKRPSGSARPARWVDPFADGEAGSQACRITVNSTPWSEVWVDGKNTAKHTPLVDYPVACGEHWIQFKRSDLKIDQVEPCVVEPETPFRRRYLLTSGDD